MMPFEGAKRKGRGMEAIIVGAGIGGLTTALFLHQKGISARLYESARELRELGVGINLLPHATKELERLGLLDQVKANGVLTREVSRFDEHGTFISSDPRGMFAGYKWPQVSTHRGKFQRVLLDSVRARLGVDKIVPDRRFTDFEEKDGKVTARFVDFSGNTHTASGDVLIAADGIHSRMREIFYPNQGAPSYSGIFLWRGISRARPFLTGASMVAVGRREQKFIAYPITYPDAQGMVTINWLAELPRAEMLQPEDWNRKGDLADFYPQFENWKWNWLDAASLMRHADGIYEFPMVDRDPIPKWSFGRATLLGDAAHAMYPVGSNGSSQAILDGAAIAEALAATKDPIAGLAAYEAERLPATTKTVQAHRERAVENATDRDQIEANTRKFQETVGFDVESVNRQ